MATPSRFRVGLVQLRVGADPAANIDAAIARIREGAARGAEIVCLPELFRTPYFCQREDPALFDLAEPIPGPTSDVLARIARELRIVIVASLFERRAAGVYHNTAVVLDADGAVRGRYRKMHIPDDPALLREVLLHARRPRLRGVRHRRRQGRDARLLGSVVPRGRPADGARRRRRALLSHRHRLASAARRPSTARRR